MANKPTMTSITILGAGVVGLSTAIELQERGYKVTILAECFPDDKKSIRYTSWWGGAYLVSLARESRQKRIDDDTFKKMWEMSEPGSDNERLFLRVLQEEYYAEPRPESLLNTYPSFTAIPDDQLRPGSVKGVKFETITIDVPNYLLHLLDRFKSQGGIIKRASVQHISQVLDGGFALSKPEALVVCAGLGARNLGGVEDKDVYPIRGQTVVIKAPWIKFGRTQSSLDGLWTYVIPRRSGEVILGGTKTDNDWYPNLIPEIAEDILKRCLKLCPELVPEDVTATREPTVDDLKPLIVEESVGLRPGRVGGIRLESVQMLNRDQKKVPVIYNYGHGGQGYLGSWGSAKIAADLLTAALKGAFAVAS